RLRHRQEVRAGAEMFATEPLTGAAEAADHLVRGEQDAVFVDDALDFGPVGARRDHEPARAPDRLAAARGPALRSDLEDLPFELAPALETEFVRRPVAALAEPVRLVDVH